MYIGELAKITGLSIKAIRHYEEIGLIKVPARKGQYRIYDQSYVPVLGMITLAKSLGFTLLELQTIVQAKTQQGLVPIDLLRNEIGIKRAALTTQLEQINGMLNGLALLEQSVIQHNQCLLQSLQNPLDSPL
ncbi:MerR family DNA-binding transcriptional regulator [Chitinibacter sp. GC72]|uniref:MerR family DNA-binding transcriptional regulator n=1 Tax=Chitinibacter sp. GC72 TaxID=1526917 RepID=UPI0012F87469|nr:MerR family DNA-binding transcriptional regulator [Chitinibacter sp. GC72]